MPISAQPQLYPSPEQSPFAQTEQSLECYDPVSLLWDMSTDLNHLADTACLDSILSSGTIESHQPSTAPSPNSIISPLIKSAEPVEDCVPLFKMFDPLWDPWKSRQDAVCSYMSEIRTVRREICFS